MKLNIRTISNKSGISREQIVNDRKIIITPGTILVEGVLNGVLVPAEEFRHFHEAWNGTPVTIGHPSENGGSAGVPHPDVPIIGRFYNALYVEDERKLVGEFWLDVLDLEEAEGGPDILANTRDGNALEVSTGYYADFDFIEGNFKKKDGELDDYFGIHRNLRPDHIAILPNSVGACSLKDGCGLSVNHASACEVEGCDGIIKSACADCTDDCNNQGMSLLKRRTIITHPLRKRTIKEK